MLDIILSPLLFVLGLSLTSPGLVAYFALKKFFSEGSYFWLAPNKKLVTKSEIIIFILITPVVGYFITH